MPLDIVPLVIGTIISGNYRTTRTDLGRPTTMSTAVVERIERLSAISARRVIEPDEEVPGHVGPGQVLPDELLSVNGLGLTLSDEHRVRLSREESASIFISGTRLEAVLLAGVGMWVVNHPDLTHPR